MINTRNIFFFGLNAVRVLSIVTLILVFASCILSLVTNVTAYNTFQSKATDADYANCDYIEGSTVPNQAAGIFWSVVSSLLILAQTVVLIMSEIGWPMKFFDQFFPVLGSNFGVGALGIFQGLIGAQILSHHVDDFSLVTGFFVFVVGCINMLLGLIFRESTKSRRSIRAWREEKKDVLPRSVEVSKPNFINPNYLSTNFTGSTNVGTDMEKGNGSLSDFGASRSLKDEKTGYGFGRQGEKAAGLRGFLLQRPEESLPRYATSPTPKRDSVDSVAVSVEVPASPASQHDLSRNKSVRTTTSSFSTPFAYRDSVPAPPVPRVVDFADQASIRSGTPPPTFKSSHTAI